MALGCQPTLNAKTLAFKVDEAGVLIVAAEDAKIDNSKFKKIFKTKAEMLSSDEVLTGVFTMLLLFLLFIYQVLCRKIS